MRWGYSLMSEEHGPRALVDAAVRAEEAGFDFVTLSDHFHPWLHSQGASPFAWSVLGAIAERTERIEIMTAVTCPTVRYHPAVIAQAAATVAVMSEGRFALGLGAGELLNEHVVGRGWPAPDQRLAMVGEAIDIMRVLWQGGSHSHHGRFFDLDTAELFTRPEVPPQILLAGGGKRALALAANVADGMFATEPSGELVEGYHDAGGRGRVLGQAVMCVSADEETGQRAAVDRWRFASGGWPVQANLPTPAAFEAATSTVRFEDLADTVSVGPDPDPHVRNLGKWLRAGFTDVCIVQVGRDQDRFFDAWERDLLPLLAATEIDGVTTAVAPD
ncbi:MAG TPA: TIGR03557 family F420-dependent LLM class oxidoreductase [Acidimicrobiia bacterium]|jgi:G6PDH family F420-dependent oxidoreductase